MSLGTSHLRWKTRRTRLRSEAFLSFCSAGSLSFERASSLGGSATGLWVWRRAAKRRPSRNDRWKSVMALASGVPLRNSTMRSFSASLTHSSFDFSPPPPLFPSSFLSSFSSTFSFFLNFDFFCFFCFLSFFLSSFSFSFFFFFFFFLLLLLLDS